MEIQRLIDMPFPFQSLGVTGEPACRQPAGLGRGWKKDSAPGRALLMHQSRVLLEHRRQAINTSPGDIRGFLKREEDVSRGRRLTKALEKEGHSGKGRKQGLRIALPSTVRHQFSVAGRNTPGVSSLTGVCLAWSFASSTHVSGWMDGWMDG